MRREQLLEQIMTRFMENVRSQAGLNDEQFERFREVTRRAFEVRNELQQQERRVWRAIEAEMRPGIAANPDSVTRLLDRLTEIHVARAEQVRRDQEAYAEFLTPVQRAQVTMGFRRLQQLVEQQFRDRMRRPGRRRPPPEF